MSHKRDDRGKFFKQHKIMKILITGATGLIGKELGLELFKRGHQLYVVSRDRKKAHFQLPFPCEVIQGDLGEGRIKHPLLDSIDAVIHLMGEGVAEKRWSFAQKTKIYESRILGTRNLVNSFIQNKPKVFVSASAVGIYGDTRDEIVDENSQAGSDFLADVCTNWEHEVDEMGKNHQVRIVKFRLPPVLARQGGALEKMLPAFQAGVGGRLGSGKQWMSWIHLQDVVSAFIQATEEEKFHGVYNLVAPEVVTNLEFSKTLAQVLKRPLGPPVPALILKTLFGQMSEVLLASQRVKSQRLEKLNFKFQFATLNKALMDILKFHHQGEEIFESKQYIPRPIEEVFSFFSEAKNLEKITPQNLKFHILEVSTPKMQEGTLIDYMLKIQGVPVKWRTLIKKWNPPYSFADQALKGPYKFWYHTHSFETLGKGTLMKDEVRFVLPLGILGWLVAHRKVIKDVRKIFDFRRKTVADSIGIL